MIASSKITRAARPGWASLLLACAAGAALARFTPLAHATSCSGLYEVWDLSRTTLEAVDGDPPSAEALEYWAEVGTAALSYDDSGNVTLKVRAVDDTYLELERQ